MDSLITSLQILSSEMGPRNLHFKILFWLDVARTTLWEPLLVAVGMVICWISKVKMRSGSLILEEPLLNLVFSHFWCFMQKEARRPCWKKANEIQIWEIEYFIRGSSSNFSCEWEREKERASTKMRKGKKGPHLFPFSRFQLKGNMPLGTFCLSCTLWLKALIRLTFWDHRLDL